MNKSTTDRGFHVITFNDLYDTECSFQESSLATERAIWLGISDAKPMVMCRDATKVGLEPESYRGWQEYPVNIPDEVFISTRMHLNREQSLQLAKMLNHFAATGEVVPIHELEVRWEDRNDSADVGCTKDDE